MLDAGYRRPAKAASPVFSGADAGLPAGEPTGLESAAPVTDGLPPASTLAPDVLDGLLRRLNPDRRPARPAAPDPVQPAQLAGLAAEVTAAADALGLRVAAITPISYGQCYRFELGRQFGEVNVFYGKRGYTLVKTTKSGSEPRLAEAGRALLSGLLFAEAPLPTAGPDAPAASPPSGLAAGIPWATEAG